MADKKKKAPAKPTAPFIGYGTNVKAGKAITKKVVKKVTTAPAKQGTRLGTKAGLGAGGQKAITPILKKYANSISFDVKLSPYELAAVNAWKKASRSKYGSDMKDIAAANRNKAKKK